MVILCYHCPVLTIQREFVKLFPPGHLIRKKIPFHSLTLAGGSDQLPRTGYVWQGYLYYDIDRVFRLSAFSCQRVARIETDAIYFAYRLVFTTCLCHPSRSIIFLSTTHWGTVNSDRNREPHHELYITPISMSTTWQKDLQKRVNASDLPDKLNYKPLYYNGLASF